MSSESVGADRLTQAMHVLRAFDVQYLFVTPSADLRYLIGYGAHPSERPTLLVVSATGSRVILVPELETPRVPMMQDLEVVVYTETSDPLGSLENVLGEPRGRAIITDSAWASVLLRLQSRWARLVFEPASPALRELRMRKSADELRCVRKAGECADRAFARLLASRFGDRSEEAIAADLNQLLREEGLDASDWGPIVASGPNSSSPHHLTGDRVVREGDVVVLDFGGTVEGYYADITRTVHVGQPSNEFAQVYDVVRAAQAAGVRAAVPGVKAQDVDRLTRNVIVESGFGDYVLHRTGHGLGLEAHEEPYIVEGNSLALEPGMVFSIEPGVYLSGRFGVRIEDIVALGPDGAERMNNATRELQIVH